MIRAIAIARAGLGDVPQERHLGLARRHRIARKPVAEIGHRVFEPLGQRRRAGQRVGTIGEELGHHLGRLEIALGVARQPPAGRVERGVVMDAGEHVEQRAIARRREPHAVGGDDRHAKRAGQLGQRLVVGIPRRAADAAAARRSTLVATEETDEPIEQAADAVMPRVEQRPAGQRDEPGGEAVELVERQRALALSARASSCASRGDRGCDSPRLRRRGREAPESGRVGRDQARTGTSAEGSRASPSGFRVPIPILIPARS